MDVQKTEGTALTVPPETNQNSHTDSNSSDPISPDNPVYPDNPVCSLNDRHCREIVQGSGVSKTIARLNFRTIEDSREVDKALSRNTDLRWQHSDHLVPGWLVTGVDPETGEKTYQGCQFKPDTPQPKRDDNGEPIPDKFNKYLSASDSPVEPLFLDPGIEGYWQWVLVTLMIVIVITEGAKKAGVSLSQGVATISIPGVWNGQKLGRLKKSLKQFLGLGRKVYLAFDSDSTENPKVRAALDDLGRRISTEGAVVYLLTWEPSKGKGLDDYLVGGGNLQELIDNAPTLEEWRKTETAKTATSQGADSDDQSNFAKTYQEIVREKLYTATQWICLAGNLYERKHTHYQESPDEIELSRITTFLKTYITTKNNRKGAFHTNPSAAKSALEWVKYCSGVTPDAINPVGALNLKNGVLVLDWGKYLPTWKLEPHNPDKWRFTYAPLFNYNPLANPEFCNKLLEALEPGELDIFLKVIASAIDLPQVHKRKGRIIKNTLLWGDGNNGKDALREAVATLFGGQGLTSAGFSDFQQYDQGRKFPLACLEYSRVNWSSENASRVPLDSLESLKSVNTRDKLTIERKGRDGYDIIPNCVCLFNLNGLPNIKANSESIRSRYAILSFRKTYKPKDEADTSKGDLIADQRFKYDPEWVKQEVIPALLNRVLAALIDLIHNGIDYSPTNNTLEEIQRENSHLLQFCQEQHLQYCPGESVTIANIWGRLELWYQENGYLEDENIGTAEKPKFKRVWSDPPRKSDPLVKGANQVQARFLCLFGKCKAGVKARDANKGKGKPVPIIKDLRFFPSSETGETDAPDSVGNSAPPSQSTVNPVLTQVNPVGQTGLTHSNSLTETFLLSENHPVNPVNPVLEKVASKNSDEEEEEW
jgi:putative DNA primase/helicase